MASLLSLSSQQATSAAASQLLQNSLANRGLLCTQRPPNSARPIGRPCIAQAVQSTDPSEGSRKGVEEDLSTKAQLLTRRQLANACAGLALFSAVDLFSQSPIPVLDGTSSLLAPPAAQALPSKPVFVGSFLPPAGVDDFVVFTPGPKDTPALRAGNVSPYTFFLPPTWTQQRIANILSGNYCQPKCAEPWIEVKFEDPKQGTLQVVASPMVRLTNKPGSKIEDIGDPETIIAALGPFVTGDSYDPDELVESSVYRRDDGQTFYRYALETPYARSGAHNLATATAKGDTVLLLVISATDKQWASSEPTLRKLIESFSV